MFSRRKLGWMLTLVSALCISLSCPAMAQVVVFDNFGTGGTYNVFSGWPVDGANGIDGRLDEAMSFTPTGANYSLDRIDLVVALGRGSNELDLALASDANGAPGTTLESFHVSNAMLDEFDFSTHPAISVNSALHPTLVAGNQYWLVASAGADDTLADWYQNSVGSSGQAGQRQNGGTWNVSNQFEGVFRVTADANTPEPGAVALLAGLGVSGGFVILRHRLRRRSL